MTYLLVFVLTLFALYAARRTLVRLVMKAIQRSPEYRARMDLVERSYRAEETVVEEADWFGTTGLPDDIERELPKYMRREAGELLFDEGSLKASDLTYIGVFEEPDARVHYWSVPSSDGKPTYAYVEVSGGSTCTGWGGREPPLASASASGAAI